MPIKENKKDKIINYAFSVWGDHGFKKTSLSMLAGKLNLTKAALYRYFKNKDEILSTMKKLLKKEFTILSLNFITNTKNKNIDEILFIYIDTYFSYFCNNYYQYLFYLYTFLKYPDEINNYQDELYFKIIDIFKKSFSKEETWFNNDDTDIIVRLIFSAGIFVINYNIFNINDKNNIKNKLKQRSQQIINDIYEIVKNGFGKEPAKEINFENVEDKSSVKIKELKRDKIFDAIVSVIAKEGPWDTTISKIAEKMGISKSSLYFHFKNKKHMMSDLIFKEIKIKNDLLEKNILLFKNLYEKIYSIIVTSATHLVYDKKTLLFFEWIHTQLLNFKKIIKKINLYDPVIKLIIDTDTDKIINTSRFSPDFIYGFLNMQIVKEIYYSKIVKIKLASTIYKYIFYFFFNGIFKDKK